MTTQELIERIEGLKNLFGNKTKYVEKDTVIKLISELDEPEKIVVPQFVAVWYEENKDDFENNLLDFIENIPDIYEKNEFEMFEEWLLETSTKPFQTLVNMHQFGYEVEKEKRYFVRLKNVDENYNYLTNIKHLNAWALTEIKRDKKFRTEHTRKELEEGGFGEVFDSPLFEIEEIIE